MNKKDGEESEIEVSNRKSEINPENVHVVIK